MVWQYLKPLTSKCRIVSLHLLSPRAQAAPVPLLAGVPFGIQVRGDLWEAPRRLQQGSRAGYGGGADLLGVDDGRLLQSHFLQVRPTWDRQASPHGENARI